jgi:hypothetical protein
MIGTLIDNSFTRNVATRLEADHNKMLGTSATMRMARAVSRVSNRKSAAARRRYHAMQLEELFAENGSQTRPTLAMRDGWAVDRTRSLPHLEQLIEDSQVIIRERGGVHRGGGERSFFQQILTDEHIARFPSILNFATSSDILRTVIDYMGMIPTLSVSKPLGVRLNESDAKLSEPTNGVYRESQLFHRDYHDQPMVYVIVTLRDVTEKSGPFSILPASTSARASAALGYGGRGRAYRITDEQMYSVVARSDLFEFACPAGSVLFVDSSACFHYGSRDAVIPRYLMMYAYVSVCRTDFGDLLRKESPTPVLDDSARTRRTRYPASDSDSRLRRLLLDRNATAG